MTFSPVLDRVADDFGGSYTAGAAYTNFGPAATTHPVEQTQTGELSRRPTRDLLFVLAAYTVDFLFYFATKVLVNRL